MKKILFVASVLLLAACAGKTPPKPVIDLPEQQIVQTSYAPAYEATQQTYQGRVNEKFYVDSFAHGVVDWFNGKYKQPISELKHQLYDQGRGFDAYIYDYYSGMIFAADLQSNFQRLHCWQGVDVPSLQQGIYDALRDLQAQRSAKNSTWIAQGSEKFAQQCRP
ncbi:hypothetical protein QV08_02755 [Gallibacterium salpingitidis]|uniref:Lipoprotein n=1 Tax=Gallibacterium salpingitidis TaxID=505341 RepID=A0A1A7Q437_9PAST|nr:hypothetical protein [Gallibacterium salpingitidis]OBW94646.1 hypothetical protein QS62_05955 [Gallibacterium salpingitidis]OBX09004.1 hypothetical protein QV08_02755 [Gallibacterium salpingitidis]OBX10123.1 hypothetical protein QV09_06755 [Gallibacterium salpingitidis]WKS98701.1 hypothetical protein NYR30_07875 [Gallibacterium salpingitidis]